MKDNAKPCRSCGNMPVTYCDEERKTIACRCAECQMKPAVQGLRDEDIVKTWNLLMGRSGNLIYKSSSSIRKIDA